MKRLLMLLILVLLVGCEASVDVVVEQPVIEEETDVDDSSEVLEEESKVDEPEDADESVSLYSSRVSTDICKIEDGLTDFRGPAGIGYDIRQYSLPSSGALRIGVIYLDFADYRWQRSESTYELTEFLIEPLQAYYDAMSGNRVQFEWTVFEEIISLPGNAEDYDITRGSYGLKIDLKDKVGQEVERRLNLNEWDVLIYAINPDVPEALADVSPTSFVAGPNESYQYHMALIGMDTRRNGAVNIIHEFGHMFGLPDLYKNVCVNNEGCQNGTIDWRLQFQYAGAWSLMSQADHPNNELMGWERFVIGWIEDEYVHCIQSKEEHLIHLNPINSEGLGTKLISINLSEDKNIIIEMKERAPYCQMCQQGVLVYTVETMIDQQDGYVKTIRPEHSTDIVFEDALLLNQPSMNQLSYDGWTIEIVESFQEGLLIRINHETT